MLKLQPGQHLVTGVIHDWNDTRINVEVPTCASFTVVSDARCDDALQLRAPAIDKRGIPKVCNLYVQTHGVVLDIVLKWAPIQADAVADGPETSVLRLQVFRDLLGEKVWNERAKKNKSTSTASAYG